VHPTSVAKADVAFGRAADDGILECTVKELITMKSRFVTTLGLAGVLAAGSLAAFAQTTPQGDAPQGEAQVERAHGKRGGWHGKRAHGKRGGFFGRGLELTDAQREQVKAITEAERAKNAALHQQIAENRQALREATKSGSFDEAQVRAIAEKGAALQAELTVSRVRVQSAIYNTVLTAEQKAKLDEMSAKRAERRADRRQNR
jgi:Spy/CpxP family protein refolding chaperone